MMLRGVRGATTVEEDRPELILAATQELLWAMLAANPGLIAEDLASAWFSLTPDLRSAFPARAVREAGWTDVPLFDCVEVDVPGSLPRCIRVMLHWNTDCSQKEVQHVYLREAVALRPDLVNAHRK